MKGIAVSILLTLLIDAFGAVVSYFRERFVAHMMSRSEGLWQNHSDVV